MVSRTEHDGGITQGILCLSCGFTKVTELTTKSIPIVEFFLDKDTEPLSAWERRVQLLMEDEEQVLERNKKEKPFFRGDWDVGF